MTVMKRIRPALAAASVLLVLTTATAFAEGLTPALVGAPEKPAPAAPEQVNADGTISLEGVLEWTDLEGGFYKVGPWSLMGDVAQFERLKGKNVVVTGKEFDGISIRMVRSLVVSQIAVKEGARGEQQPVAEPVAVDGVISLEGTVEYSSLEGGFYTIDGWGLLGDESLFKALQGKRVIIRGKEFTGVSFRQVPQIEVDTVMLPVAANHSLPTSINVNGTKIPTGQEAVVVDGVLMVPLRHVVEKAGGKVQWDAREQAVVVEMADRMAYFWIGQAEAEMNEHNVRYFTRNLVAMTRAPLIINGRTMVSADALTQILGLYEVAGIDGEMDLAPMK